MMMLTALVGEVSAARERIDTHEQLAAVCLPATRAAVEEFEASAQVAQRRSDERQAMLGRVYRVMFEELELARRREAEGDER